MARRGISIFEIVALICIIAAAYVGDVVGSKYSNLLGILGMIVFPVALVFFIEWLAWLERELLLGQKPLPLCRCGKDVIDKMTVAEEGGRSFCRCVCGLKYDISGRGRIMICDRDGMKEFAVWKPFKGWQINEKDLCRR